ncbi:hypothetical protein GCM10007103_04620 [Salinimicrobium marinum]|uniref:Outer membrane protein beta-barrel domain-containing protein n=2 Tax=Salinimicrobium marinum TaxID=680283 RepID=A0A918VUD1_9FLAO|nr:hypothetical protein GCM10007103_04620 [Salinimicrobium marinum]
MLMVKKTLVVILFIFASLQVQAQFIKEKAIDVSIGSGLSSPYGEYDIMGSGFYTQGEFVLSLNNWIDIRPYAGLILTKPGGDDTENKEAGYKSTANAFLFGGKTRLTIPIPWVAPYFEIGVGASIGSFETFTPDTDLEESGFIYHTPISLGLELGPMHNFNLEFTYYYHDSVQQTAGAVAFGVSIPVGND